MLRTLARTVPRRVAAQVQARHLSTVSPIYTTTSTATGSRAAGTIKTDAGLELKMDMPKEVRSPFLSSSSSAPPPRSGSHSSR